MTRNILQYYFNILPFEAFKPKRKRGLRDEEKDRAAFSTALKKFATLSPRLSRVYNKRCGHILVGDEFRCADDIAKNLLTGSVFYHFTMKSGARISLSLEIVVQN